MPVTQADLDRINAEIATAERQVTVGDQTTIYRSTTDLIAARDDIERRLIAQKNAVAVDKRPRVKYLQYGGRGYE